MHIIEESALTFMTFREKMEFILRTTALCLSTLSSLDVILSRMGTRNQSKAQR